ncbi:hypothetical protein CPB86DRAFT_704131 [Serendipita vermifera]|nr:hypothetical protein CPB86DRAFT_704131 [Serendipita vermifera]
MSVRKLGGMRAAEQRAHLIRVQQGREAVASSDVSLDDRQRVIDAFQKACLAENEKDRRRTIEQRIQEAIAQGGAGTTSVDDSMQNKPNAIPVEGGATTTTAAPNPDQPPALPPRSQVKAAPSKLAPDAAEVMSPVEWGEAEEAEFRRQLEVAKAASEPGHQGKGNEQSDEEFERGLRIAMEASLAEQRALERDLLKAAAQWREGEGIPADGK